MSERDELRARARKAFPAKYPDADAVVAAMADFAASERDRARNEALDAAASDEHLSDWAQERIRKHKRPHPPAQLVETPIGLYIEERFMRPDPTLKPPAQQDDGLGDNDSWTGPEATMAPRGETPARESSPSPAPFDIESRARELLDAMPTVGYPTTPHNPIVKAAALKGMLTLARETAEAIAREIHELDWRITSDPSRGWAMAECEAVACSHARPPQPAPETTEERYRKALEEIAGPSSARVMHGKGCSCVACRAHRALEKP